MSDQNRDTNPDGHPGQNSDTRSDIEQAVESRNDDVERAGGGAKHSPLEPTGVPDGVAGTGGVVKNQDNLAQ